MVRHNPVSNPGRLIAERYRLENKLGEGAMGVVWSATDELLRREVAIKEVRLPPQMPEEEAAEVRERALREARAIAVVTHPNVVTLYDVAREDGDSFVVMELVPSQSLATILRRHGALDDTQLALVADGVAAALDAAHRAGVVHRDVKPGNVLISDDGRIKLSDFGISRNAAEQTITKTGILLGTPSYLAPEIASGDRVTAAADLWGLGATLFAAGEGVPPYAVNDDALATVTAVVHDPVPAPTRPGVIGEVISGLMVKDPARRMSSGEVRRRVQRLLPEPGTRPFEMLLDPEASTVRVRQFSKPTQTKQSPPSGSVSAAPLAADPGPLPFTPQQAPSPAKPRRRTGRILLLGIAAVMVFAVSSVGGYAAAHIARDLVDVPEGLVPFLSPQPERTPPQDQLAMRTGTAVHTNAESGGDFQIAVPVNWGFFQEERDDLSNSMVITYVSRDGRFTASVQRFGDFYGAGGNGVDSYYTRLAELVGDKDGRFELTSRQAEPAKVDYSTSPAVQFSYRFSDNGITSGLVPITRNSFERLIPFHDDLWSVRVTGPASATERTRTLYERIAPSFEPVA